MSCAYRYFVPDWGETVEDAAPILDVCSDEEDAAETAAKLVYERDCEWHKGKRTIAIIAENGDVTKHDVEIEYQPSFFVNNAT